MCPTVISNFSVASRKGQAASGSNFSVASRTGQAASGSNFSVASRMGQAASGSNFSVAATEKLPVRAVSYKAVFSIQATKQLATKVASVRLA
jgi:hypothetical protein